MMKEIYNIFGIKVREENVASLKVIVEKGTKMDKVLGRINGNFLQLDQLAQLSSYLKELMLLTNYSCRNGSEEASHPYNQNIAQGHEE